LRSREGPREGPRARRCPTCPQIFSGEARFCPFDGDALVETDDWNPSADPLIGQVIDGRYEVVSVIGEGGMGTVYEVRHTTLGRSFALKVLRRDLAGAEHSARFIQEAKAAAAIGHPNIVAVSDFGEVNLDGDNSPAVPYFVMEFLTGISLAALLRVEKTLAPPRAAAILLQCASGLAAAHDAGVVHRDLKPDNVFLIRSGDREFVKLLDFGVAKIAGVGRLTRAGMVFGTPHYMSPEQAAGRSVDRRADIYALGVVLYECLSGKVPFEADTYMGVLTKHMFAIPEPIDRVAPDASRLGALGPIAMRCLAKDPLDRFKNMAEVAAAIEQATGAPGRAAGSVGFYDHVMRALGLRAGHRAESRASGSKPNARALRGGLLVLGLGALAVGIGLVARVGTQSSAVLERARASAVHALSTAAASAVESEMKTAIIADPMATAAEVATAAVPTASAEAKTESGDAPRAPDSALFRSRAIPLGQRARPRPVETADKRGDVIDPWR
jgi:serine/threonine-protein kinase